MKTLEDKLKAQ